MHLALRLSALLVLAICCDAAFGEDATPVYSDKFPPFVLMDESERIAGISVDILENLEQQDAPHKYHITLYPWKRAYELLLREPNTLGLAVRRTNDREAYFHWIGPYYRGTVSLYGLASTDETTIKDGKWKTLNIGVKRGASDARWLLRNGVQSSALDESDTDLQNLKKLMLGRVQLVPMLKEESVYYAEALNISVDKLVPYVLLDCSVELYMVTSVRSTPAFVERVRNAYEHVRHANAYDPTNNKNHPPCNE